MCVILSEFCKIIILLRVAQMRTLKWLTVLRNLTSKLESNRCTAYLNIYCHIEYFIEH